jgi:hypothetical protein
MHHYLGEGEARGRQNKMSENPGRAEPKSARLFISLTENMHLETL